MTCPGMGIVFMDSDLNLIPPKREPLCPVGSVKVKGKVVPELH